MCSGGESTTLVSGFSSVVHSGVFMVQYVTMETTLTSVKEEHKQKMQELEEKSREKDTTIDGQKSKVCDNMNSSGWSGRGRGQGLNKQ